MKTLFVLPAMAFMALLTFASPTHAADGPEIGKAAPEFTLTDTTGTSHNLSDFKGKNVVLEWTNHECPYVVKHYETGNMQKLQKEATEKDVVWLSINSSAEGRQGHITQETGAEVKEKVGSNATALLLDADGTVGNLYEAETTPHVFVINKDGVLVYKGAIDDNSSARHDSVEGAKNYVMAALDSLDKGEAVATPSTQPYGCSVKYQLPWKQ